MTARICLIDLSGIARQQWHATEHEGASAMVGKTLQAVTGCVAGFDHVGICVDTPPYKRSELSPEYKAHREKTPTVYFEQLSAIIERLDRNGYHILGARGYEADDIIATVCEWAAEKHPGEISTVIFSADKDLLQLVRVGSVEVISSATGAVFSDAEAVVTKLGVKPELVPDWLALVGDKSDGIPGVYGVGQKTAAAWLTQHGSLEAVLLAADKLEPARFRPAVKDGRELISKSFKLVQLMYDAPIDPEVLLTKKEIKLDEQATAPEEPAIDAVDPAPSAALVPAERYLPQPTVEYERQLEPRDSNGAVKLARFLYDSRMFGNFPTPEAVLAIILAGRAHGLGAVQSLQGFHNVDGKPSPSAQLIIGLCKRHPSCKYFTLIESTSTSATYETWREGDPQPTRLTYTIEQAKLAGLLDRKGGTWLRHPDPLLRARCGSSLGKVVYPDIVGGLLTPDEMEDAR